MTATEGPFPGTSDPGTRLTAVPHPDTPPVQHHTICTRVTVDGMGTGLMAAHLLWVRPTDDHRVIRTSLYSTADIVTPKTLQNQNLTMQAMAQALRRGMIETSVAHTPNNGSHAVIYHIERTGLLPPRLRMADVLVAQAMWASATGYWPNLDTIQTLRLRRINNTGAIRKRLQDRDITRTGLYRMACRFLRELRYDVTHVSNTKPAVGRSPVDGMTELEDVVLHLIRKPT